LFSLPLLLVPILSEHPRDAPRIMLTTQQSVCRFGAAISDYFARLAREGATSDDAEIADELLGA
jgi:hypothetical protein